MPEIAAGCILPKIQSDFNIPILSLVIDEMTAETGYITRLEAFYDLLEQSQSRKRMNPEEESIINA